MSTTSSAPPAVRQQFARRLRALRLVRGFRTARSLATTLGIDENRYTRYERAEVEPDFELIERICDTLRVTPNELFGLKAGTPGEGGADRAVTPGFAEASAGFSTRPASAGSTQARHDSVAWRLAYAVAELSEDGEAAQPAGTSPLAILQRTAKLFADLERRPFATVSEILLLPAVTNAPGPQARQIGELIQTLTSGAA